jgi:8-oxo-dGTP diphosphatase
MLVMHVFEAEPLNFFPKVSVAGCFCACRGKFLILQRNPKSSQGMTWGVPAGKMEAGELPLETAIREVREETGLKLKRSELELIGSLYIQLPTIHYVFHMFYKKFETIPSLEICLEENLQASWVSVEEALQMPLIAGGIEAVKKYQQFLSQKRES